MSRCIDIPIHLDATVHTGARLADRDQHSVYERNYSLETSPGSYRWVCSEMRPQADLIRSYASHSDFLHRLSDECHKLDADALVDHEIDHEDYSCHMEIYVFWDQNDCRAVEEVKPENWATIVAEMNRRLRYWDRSGTASVSFFVKWIYTPIEHDSLPTDQPSWTSDMAVRTGGAVASSTQSETEPPLQETGIAVDTSVAA